MPTFTSVVIYGHPLHSHTHSYIHQGFYRGFTREGFTTYWVSTAAEAETLALGNRPLFITEGQVDTGIPLLAHGWYLLHNCKKDKYVEGGVPVAHIRNMQSYTRDAITRYNVVPMKEFGFKNVRGDGLFTAWATDLFPEEIEANIARLDEIRSMRQQEVNFVGMHRPVWNEVKAWCDANGVAYKQYGGFSKTNVDTAENVRLIQTSLVAPAVQNERQTTVGYVPCRIFKNISYGHMGVTNNEAVNELFNGRLVFHRDVSALMDAGAAFDDLDLLRDLMREVQAKHTYVNRVRLILAFFSDVVE